MQLPILYYLLDLFNSCHNIVIILIIRVALAMGKKRSAVDDVNYENKEVTAMERRLNNEE